jgi:hypothetical protein
VSAPTEDLLIELERNVLLHRSTVAHKLCSDNTPDAILVVAVLAIIVTAPVGLVLIRWLGPRLLREIPY